MSIIKTKSDENYDAADLLINNSKLSSSIHCLYYGAYQRAMYAMKESGIGYEKQKENYTNYCADPAVTSGKSKRLGSHEFLISEFVKLMMSKTGGNIKLVGNLTRSFLYLKTIRRKADYENDSISEADIYDCKAKADFLKETIDEFIKNNFAA